MSEPCKQFSDDGYDGTGCWKSSGICRHCGKTEFMHRQAMTDPEPDLVGALRAAFETLIAGGPDEVRPAESALRAEIERLKATARKATTDAHRWEIDLSSETRFRDAAQARAEKAEAERDALRDAHALCREGANDNALWDNTPGAHPAFWRGQDDGVRGACRVIEKALAGDTEGKCQEPIQAVRDKIAALKADRDRLARLVRGAHRIRCGCGETFGFVDEECADLRAHIEGLKAEIEDDGNLIERQGRLLTGVANALKGEPKPLSTHSHHDLPEVARDLKAALRKAEGERDALRGSEDHPESKCQRCGGRNITWFAESPLWNAVAKEWSIICPICFGELATAAEERLRSLGLLSIAVWRLAPEDMSDECQNLRVQLHAEREAISSLKADRDRLSHECGKLGILADVASDIVWGGEQGWMEPGFLEKLGPALRKRFNDLYRDRDRLARLLRSTLDTIDYIYKQDGHCWGAADEPTDHAEARAAAEAAGREDP